MRAGVDGSAALLFCSFAVLDEIGRLEDRDSRRRQERHVYVGNWGRRSSENDMMDAMKKRSSGGSFDFLRQNPMLRRQ